MIFYTIEVSSIISFISAWNILMWRDSDFRLLSSYRKCKK